MGSKPAIVNERNVLGNSPCFRGSAISSDVGPSSLPEDTADEQFSNEVCSVTMPIYSGHRLKGYYPHAVSAPIIHVSHRNGPSPGSCAISRVLLCISSKERKKTTRGIP